MTLVEVLDRGDVVLAEGAVIERLRRNPAVQLDDHVANAGLIRCAVGRAAMEHIYRSYLDIGRETGLPMIVLTPTWRASRERLRAAGLDERDDLNADAGRFLPAIRQQYGPYVGRIYVGGLLGCRGDAYRPDEALSAADAQAFHRWQVDRLATAGVDFLIASTLPAASEALGLGLAMGATGLPYVISPVVRSSGQLLDGTALHELITQIDATVRPAPMAYLCNCVHPASLAAALERESTTRPILRRRLVGLQANASRRSPEELDGADALDADDPETLADAMLDLHRRFGLRILGGCCGTDERHIRCLARRLTFGSGSDRPGHVRS